MASPILGKWSDAISSRKIPLLLSALVGLIVSIPLIMPIELNKFFLVLIMFTVGAACSGQALSFAVIREINGKDSTTALGFNNMMVVFSGVLCIPAASKLIAWHSTKHAIIGAINYNAGDYRYGAIIVPLCFAIGLVICAFGIKETNCKAVDE